MTENRIERITAAEFRSWGELASNPLIDTSPHDVGTVLRPAVGRAVRDLVFLRTEVNVLTKAAADVDQIRSDLCSRLGLTLDEFTDRPSRRKGPNSKAIKLAVAAELLRRRGVQREAIGVVLAYSKPGVDNLLELLGRRMARSPAFLAYVERVARREIGACQ